MSDKFIWLDQGTCTSPAGYRASGVAAGIKAGQEDMALLVSDSPAALAGLFTSNRVAAAPVRLGRKHLAGGMARAVIINSGCANACTGPGGYDDAVEMARLTAAGLGIEPELVQVSSTGVIGRRLPMDRVAAGIDLAIAALTRQGGDSAAKAIMTTDTVDKQGAVQFQHEGTTITIGGMCKGAGMISPNMATMLAYLTTDANIAPAHLQDALTAAVNRSFNRITVDGDQSTNDTVLLLANGAAGSAEISPASPAWPTFCAALDALCLDLAQKIVRDGAGATKFVTVSAVGARSAADALAVARAIANSPLFKTACFGGDPNWGRVICAVGYSGAEVDDQEVQIYFDDVCVYDRGQIADASARSRLAEVMKQTDFTVTVDLNLGSSADTVYTCDFSYDYVKINGEYTT